MFTYFPDGWFNFLWEWFSVGLVLYECVSLPAYLVWDQIIIEDLKQQQSIGWVLQTGGAIEAFFLVDILVGFNTGYYDKGVLIMNRRHIALRYLESTFVFDLISSFPVFLGLCVMIISYPHFLTNPESWVHQKELNLICTLKLLRFYKLHIFERRLFDMTASDQLNFVLSITKLLFLMTILVHWSACFFTLTGLYMMEDSEMGYSWITRQSL